MPVLKPYLERIIEKPTWGEITEETNIAAEDFLTLMGNRKAFFQNYPIDFIYKISCITLYSMISYTK